MKRIANIIQSLVPEIFAIIICTVLFIVFPNFFISLGVALTKGDNYIIKSISVFIALTSGTIFLGWKIHAPLNNSNTALYKWDDFYKIKDINILSIILSVLITLFCTYTLLMAQELASITIGFRFFTSLILMLLITGSQLLSAFKLKELLDVHEDEEEE